MYSPFNDDWNGRLEEAFEVDISRGFVWRVKVSYAMVDDGANSLALQSIYFGKRNYGPLLETMMVDMLHVALALLAR